MGITDVGSDLSELPVEVMLENFHRAVDQAIEHASDESFGLLYEAFRQQAELRYREALKLAEQYVALHPHDFEGMSTLADTLAPTRDATTARRYVSQMILLARDDALQLNSLLNNLLFIGLQEEAAELARTVMPRFPEHGFISYQGHRILLWVGAVDEARPYIDIVRAAKFPEANVTLMLLRQACAEGAIKAAKAHAEILAGGDDPDLTYSFITHSVMGDSEKAHQVLVDADLDIQALRSFLGYPYFDHSYFPELVRIFQQQGIDRPYIDGPPYRCEVEPTT